MEGDYKKKKKKKRGPSVLVGKCSGGADAGVGGEVKCALQQFSLCADRRHMESE